MGLHRGRAERRPRSRCPFAQAADGDVRVALVELATLVQQRDQRGVVPASAVTETVEPAFLEHLATEPIEDGVHRAVDGGPRR